MSTLIKRIFALAFLAAVIGTAVYFIYHREQAVQAVTHPDTAQLYEAAYYEPLEGKKVQCFLCPNFCVMAPGQYGICKARKNIDGKLYAMVYGKVASVHVDPIEKKPFFHFLPGTNVFSIGTTGCNMRCSFCQNWEISQCFPDGVRTQKATPEQLVTAALEAEVPTIAFTYNEPVIIYEYVLDTAKLAKEKGLRVVLVSNGYIELEPLKELLKYLDGFKVDFKAFYPQFYRKFTGGSVDPVLKAMKAIQESGVWLEIVTLLVPGENDSEEEIRDMSRWIKENLGEGAPLHFSRFFPQYKLRNLPPTPDETLIRAREIAMEEGLKFVYTGNIAYPEGEATYCPKSGEVAIERKGYFITSDILKDGACPDGEKIPGVWN